MPAPQLRKLVVELRYPANLSFYGKMDEIGLHFSDDYPDWKRSSHSLEVVSKKKHSKIFLSTKRCFVEMDSDSETPGVEYEFAKDRILQIRDKLGLSQIDRIGVRQWFAIDIEKSFAKTVDIIS